MSETTTYNVLRHHLGDKPYAKGDTRELIASDASTLVKLGVLSEAKPQAKSEKVEKPTKSKAKGKA